MTPGMTPGAGGQPPVLQQLEWVKSLLELILLLLAIPFLLRHLFKPGGLRDLAEGHFG